MPKVSVIIPVYNVEKYLRQCLDSVVSQTLSDIEIICVNDGSTDGCGDILTEYAKKDNRIKIISKSNSGYGNSMNMGLSIAIGEYIGIVESDDYIEPNMFEYLYNTAITHNADVVKSNFFEYYEQIDTDVVKELIPDYCLNKVLKPSDYPSIFRMMPSIWSAIYRKDFLNDNKIRFVESPGASYQDTGFNFKVWAMAKRAYFIKDALLHYRSDNVGSSVKSSGKVFCVCDEFASIESYLKQHDIYDQFKYIMSYIKYHTYMWNYKRLKEPAKTQFFKIFSEQLKSHLDANELKADIFGKKHFKRAIKICCHPRLFVFVYKIQHFPKIIVGKINKLIRIKK